MADRDIVERLQELSRSTRRQGGGNSNLGKLAEKAASEIEDLRARAEKAEAELRDATEWRSMETAPRDGTPILVGRPGYFSEVYRWRSDILGCDWPWLIPMPGEDAMRLKPIAWLPFPNPEAGQ